MGTIYWETEIDRRWVSVESYTVVSFHYFYNRLATQRFDTIYEDKWPEIRKWVIRECEGEIMVSYDHNDFRQWVDLYFEYSSDAVAFKLRWF